MDILFNKQGNPVAISSRRMFAISTSQTAAPIEAPQRTFAFGTRNFVQWGPSNRAPEELDKIIGGTSVLSTGLNYLVRAAFGQGVRLSDVSSLRNTSTENLAATTTHATRYLASYAFRTYATAALRDLYKFGNAFPVFYFNNDGTQIVSLRTINARHCRLSTDRRHLLIFGDYQHRTPDPQNKEAVQIRMLDQDDPWLDLECLRAAGKIKGAPLAFPRLISLFSNNDYYASPIWEPALRSGWIDVARKVPLFLKKSYANAMTMMWHVQIPATYWDERFPRADYTPEERQQAIEQYMQEVENSLCGEENGSKTLFTSYYLGPSGRMEEDWKIERLKNDVEAQERLTTSAAANSEILFALMINPSVLGAGMPGGAYAGTAGSGSDIRESYLISIITTYLEKQQILDPVRLLYYYNTGNDLHLQYKETILTTLNTGQAQQTVATE